MSHNRVCLVFAVPFDRVSSCLPYALGYIQTIKDEGMPIYGESAYGDMYVEYNVVLPNSLSPEMKRSELFMFPVFLVPLTDTLLLEFAEVFHGQAAHPKDEL